VLTRYLSAPRLHLNETNLLMVTYRTILAILIALAVAVAPLGAAFAAIHEGAQPAIHDCDGPTPSDMPCCDAKAACPDSCGIACCKLMGMITVLPVFDLTVVVPARAADPPKPPDWQQRPQPPPPRS